MGVAPLEDYVTLDDSIKQGQVNGPAQLTDIVEITPDFQPIALQTNSDDIKVLTAEVGTEYRKLVESGDLTPGPFGDLINILQVEDKKYVITSIGQKAFHKPGLAADLGVVLKGKDALGEDVIYLITGKRKANPGKGKSAWFGGFTGIALKDGDQAYQLDSGIYTALKEGFEEGDVHIDCPEIEDLRTSYDADNVNVNIQLGAYSFVGEIIYLGTIKTSDELLENGGERLANDLKRVYATSGYLCVSDLNDMNLNENQLASWFKAGDDIKDLIFTNITSQVKTGQVGDLTSTLDFGIKHHNDFIAPVIETANQVFYDSSEGE